MHAFARQPRLSILGTNRVEDDRRLTVDHENAMSRMRSLGSFVGHVATDCRPMSSTGSRLGRSLALPANTQPCCNPFLPVRHSTPLELESLTVSPREVKTMSMCPPFGYWHRCVAMIHPFWHSAGQVAGMPLSVGGWAARWSPTMPSAPRWGKRRARLSGAVPASPKYLHRGNDRRLLSRIPENGWGRAAGTRRQRSLSCDARHVAAREHGRRGTDPRPWPNDRRRCASAGT